MLRNDMQKEKRKRKSGPHGKDHYLKRKMTLV